MIRCLVTDRRRLAGPDASFEHARRALRAQVEQAAGNGVDLIQVRERDLEARDLAVLVADIVSLVRGTRSRVVVNDRLDIAIACGAHGVHLRSDSIPTSAARRLAAPGFTIGRSVHDVQEARASQDADYLIAGTVYPSASKPSSARLLGVEGLRAVVNAVGVPVLAIGGVTPARFDEIVNAGAGGVAGIGLFLPDGHE